MLIARIKVSGVHAEVITCTDIPAGLAGGQIQIEYDDSVWSDLRKTVVFKGYTTVDIITDAATIVIPPEVVSRQHVRLSVGILGTSPDGAVVVPTLWADLGIVKPATDPSGDNAADPQLPIWAQLLHMIGDLNGLGTTAKDSLVAAVNELLKTSGGSGGINPDAVKQLIETHIAEHSEIDDQCHPDIRYVLDDLGQRFGDLEQDFQDQPAWTQQPQKPSYTAQEVGALPVDTPIPTDDHINGLIDTKLGVIENGTY